MYKENFKKIMNKFGNTDLYPILLLSNLLTLNIIALRTFPVMSTVMQLIQGFETGNYIDVAKEFTGIFSISTLGLLDLLALAGIKSAIKNVKKGQT